MNQKLDEIRVVYNQLNSLRLQERCFFDFRASAEKMLHLIKDLQDEGIQTSMGIDFQQVYSRLSRTLGRQVLHINSHQERMNKKNAAKIRRSEYDKSVEDAISQVHADIILILTNQVKIY